MIRTVLRSLLLFFILLAALITFMLTPTGLRVSAALTSKLLPGTLTYQKISGVLIGPITVDHLHYQDDQQTITIHQLRFNWLPTALLKKQLEISTLEVDDLHIINKKNTPLKWNTPTIKAIIKNVENAISFFHLQINHALIKKIDYDSAVNTQSFHLDKLYLHSLPSETKWDTTFFAKLKKPQQLTLAMQLQGNPNHYSLSFSANGDHTKWLLIGTGDQNTLSFSTPNTQLLNGLLDMKLNITSQNGTQWSGGISAKNIDLSRMNPDWTSPLNFTLTGTEKQNGDNADPTFDIHANSQLDKKNHQIDIALSGTLKKQSLTAHAHLPKSTIDLHLTGQLNANNEWAGIVDQLNFSIKNATTWRLQKTAALSASSNAFSISSLCLQSPQTGSSCLQGKWSNGKIDLTAALDINNFKWISAWTHFIKISQGKLDAHIKIEGDITKPNLTGTVNLNNTRIIFPRLNVTLDSVTASLAGNSRVLNFTAQALSQHQPLIAKGAVDLTSSDFLAKINVTSNNALILNTDEYTATATSDLNVAFKNTDIDITGKITIPKAIIKSNDYQSTTTLPGNDIVYVGNVTPPPKPFWNVNTDIMVTLGDDVDIDNISGFSAKLGGNLRLLQMNNGDLLGTGRIIGRSGTYVIYGQTLTITPDSYVEYSNNLLDNPQLNLKASKQIQSMSHMGSEFMQSDLMVGIELRGNVHSPKISFFSNRSSLSQADILSYILLGYGSSSPIPGNTDLLLRALSAVKLTSQGLLGKQNIATQIQSGLGLSELGVESETTVDSQGNTLDRQSAFVVGKNLTRRFYARYSIGILDPVNVFELRYLINRQWAVQTDSSTLGNGADVLYTISKS